VPVGVVRDAVARRVTAGPGDGADLGRRREELDVDRYAVRLTGDLAPGTGTKAGLRAGGTREGGVGESQP